MKQTALIVGYLLVALARQIARDISAVWRMTEP